MYHVINLKLYKYTVGQFLLVPQVLLRRNFPVRLLYELKDTWEESRAMARITRRYKIIFRQRKKRRRGHSENLSQSSLIKQKHERDSFIRSCSDRCLVKSHSYIRNFSLSYQLENLHVSFEVSSIIDNRDTN